MVRWSSCLRVFFRFFRGGNCEVSGIWIVGWVEVFYLMFIEVIGKLEVGELVLVVLEFVDFDWSVCCYSWCVEDVYYMF